LLASHPFGLTTFSTTTTW